MGLFSRKTDLPTGSGPLPDPILDVFVDLLFVAEPTFAPTAAGAMLATGVDHSRYSALAEHEPALAELLGRCRFAIRLSDVPADGLAPRDRHARFAAAVRAVAEATEPVLIAPSATAQVLVPEVLEDPFLPIVNVRTTQSVEAAGAVIVDTVGLAALGIPDLQCHAKGIPPDDLAAFLRGIADVLLDDPTVIHDGNSIQGLDFHDRWKCRLRGSLREPSRRVLDVDPGRHYAPV